jgi:phosphoribosylformylglycinamidine synthase I
MIDSVDSLVKTDDEYALFREIRSLVVTGFGINCEAETAAAYDLLGVTSHIVHLNEIFNERVSLHDYDILNLPGGFSFGDDLGSAKVLASKLKYKRMKSGKRFMDELQRFLGDGKFILGICNGFQVLVKTGLLPNVGGSLEQEVTLTHNDSGKFEDRWCVCRVADRSSSPFLKGIDVIDLPVRHGEGKLVFSCRAVEEIVVQKSLNCLSYCDRNGINTSEYPFNPNGSELNCAGMTDENGQIFGMMPHPEAYLSLYNHPNWPRIKREGRQSTEEGHGLAIFRNIIEHIVDGRPQNAARKGVHTSPDRDLATNEDDRVF